MPTGKALEQFIKELIWWFKQQWFELRIRADLIKEERKIPEPEQPKPIIIEHPPDGSRAQELLGGAIEIKAPYKTD